MACSRQNCGDSARHVRTFNALHSSGHTLGGVSGRLIQAGASPRGKMRSVPRYGLVHHLTEGLAAIDLVVSEPLQDNKLLGLTGARKHRLALLRRHQTVIAASANISPRFWKHPSISMGGGEVFGPRVRCCKKGAAGRVVHGATLFWVRGGAKWR